ncbi:hypothetical protein NDU88_001696 [Pleurodeles waltl]|uniref:Uncharacterized protein n=1 Tax=Pleurodeles waltl TaxID=8319 RepID=A0AAV7R7Y7_PLEWA|nr:hypothetical protein NDU88_001696 [Pleurodeles waltl]
MKFCRGLSAPEQLKQAITLSSSTQLIGGLRGIPWPSNTRCGLLSISRTTQIGCMCCRRAARPSSGLLTCRSAMVRPGPILSS